MDSAARPSIDAGKFGVTITHSSFRWAEHSKNETKNKEDTAPTVTTISSSVCQKKKNINDKETFFEWV